MEAVDVAARQEHHITARRGEGLVTAQELQLAVDHVKRLVGPLVDMRWRPATRRHHRLYQTDLPAGLLTGEHDRVEVSVEPGRRPVPVRDAQSALLCVLQVTLPSGTLKVISDPINR
nr:MULTISPECIES: hypothetical protein [Kribbella]